MDLSYNEDKEKRKKAASDGGEDDQMLRAGGKHGEVWFWRRCRGHELQTWSVYRQRETDGKMGDSNGYQ